MAQATAQRKAQYLAIASNLAAHEIVNLGRFPEHQRIVLFDCGAHHGSWTEAFFATYPEAAVEAHLFEPSEPNCKFILELHDEVFGPCRPHHSIKLNAVAVGEREETLSLYADKPGSGTASLVDRPDFPSTGSQPVRVTTLDRYAEQAGVQRVDLLKLDLEGWEWRALKGARRLFAEQRIGAVLFEFSQANVFTRTFFRDIWLILQPAGFDLFYIESWNGYRLRPVLEYDGQWEKFWGTSMFYAKHKSLAVEPVLAA